MGGHGSGRKARRRDGPGINCTVAVAEQRRGEQRGITLGQWTGRDGYSERAYQGHLYSKTEKESDRRERVLIEGIMGRLPKTGPPLPEGVEEVKK